MNWGRGVCRTQRVRVVTLGLTAGDRSYRDHALQHRFLGDQRRASVVPRTPPRRRIATEEGLGLEPHRVLLARRLMRAEYHAASCGGRRHAPVFKRVHVRALQPLLLELRLVARLSRLALLRGLVNERLK